MSEQFFKHIKKAGEGISLSHEERERMRRTLHSYMEMKPIRTPVPSVATMRFGWMFTLRPILASLALVFLVSSAGISSQAENALPGDLLYPIKTQFNEPILGTLAFSASEKTLWSNNVAQERVKEAATLDTQGRLSSTTQEELQVSFQQHSQLADENSTPTATSTPHTLAVTNDNGGASRFQTRVTEYETMLSKTGRGTSGGPSLASGITSDLNHDASLHVHIDPNASSTSVGAGAAFMTSASSSTQPSKKPVFSYKTHHHTDGATSTSTEIISAFVSASSTASSTTPTPQSDSSNPLQDNEWNPVIPISVPTVSPPVNVPISF